jgi:hypothetical protein
MAGLSGGSLWRIAFNDFEEKGLSNPDPKVAGVAFWGTEEENGVRRIICHGPVSVYDRPLAIINE